MEWEEGVFNLCAQRCLFNFLGWAEPDSRFALFNGKTLSRNLIVVCRQVVVAAVELPKWVTVFLRQQQEFLLLLLLLSRWMMAI